MCDLETSEMRRPRPELGCCVDDEVWSVEIASQ